MIKTIPYEELTLEKAAAGCFVTGMPNELYHQFTAISNSGLSKVARSPAHYMHTAKKDPSRAMAMGSALHAAILEPDPYKSDYCVVEGITARTKSEYKEAAKIHTPERTLTQTEGDKIASMQEAIYSDEQSAMSLADSAWCELSAFATDPETGVLVKCRFDRLSKLGHALDLKKTRDSSRIGFSKSVNEYRYHVQQALYSDVYEWITGEPLESFKFLACEEDLPHNPMVYELDFEAVEIGRMLYREALNEYAQCVLNNNWRGYEKTGEPLSLPPWVLAQFENDLEVS